MYDSDIFTLLSYCAVVNNFQLDQFSTDFQQKFLSRANKKSTYNFEKKGLDSFCLDSWIHYADKYLLVQEWPTEH